MLRVTLLGNLGADPEVRYSQKGTQITSFRVAVNQVRTGPDGERQENTEWFRVRVAGRLGEFVQRLTKGTRVLVMGRLDIGHYQAQSGEMRTSYDVWADEVVSISQRLPGADAEAAEPDAEPALAGVSSIDAAAAGRSQPTNGARTRTASARAPGAPAGEAQEDLEDLPF
jgi:single-strand DNA-binding protein